MPERSRVELTWDASSEKWDVALDRRSTGSFEGKETAEAAAVALAQKHQPSQLVIHTRDGKFEEERTYPRSSDPRRTPG
jgi:hypothetical protein